MEGDNQRSPRGRLEESEEESRAVSSGEPRTTVQGTHPQSWGLVHVVYIVDL